MVKAQASLLLIDQSKSIQPIQISLLIIHLLLQAPRSGELHQVRRGKHPLEGILGREL